MDDPRAEPLKDLAVTIVLPAGMAPVERGGRVADLPGGESIELDVQGGNASFVLPRLDLYSLVVLEP